MSNIVFTDGSVWSTSKLNMVNDALIAIGETPLPEDFILDDTQLGTDIDIASRLISNVMVEVQSRGWYFNTDYNFRLVPDIDGFIAMPPNTLRVDFGNSSDPHRYILKDNKIYDVLEQTYYIGRELEADVIWLIDYNSLPHEAYDYMTKRAARMLQALQIGSNELDKTLVRDEVDALNNLMRIQLQVQNYRLRNNRVSTRIHNGWLVRGLYQSSNRRMF
jgi:hypothetical protein